MKEFFIALISNQLNRVEKLNKVKDKENLGISNADVYQMYAYAKRYKCPKVIMLYPKHIEDINKDFRFIDGNLLFIRTINIQRNLKDEKEKLKLKKELKAIIIFEKGEQNGEKL